MSRPARFLLLSLAGAVLIPVWAAGSGDEIVFRSDVSLIRVDAQVLDRGNRAVTGLHTDDFILREDGRPQQIRNFESENMPVDVILLLDVSASMRPHVEHIFSASHQALNVLGDKDRVAVMVFDRASRLRLPFRNSRQDVEREMESLLRQERFNGGTDITSGLIDAADYMAREARRDARRAIVILTDDRTERDRDEERVSRALTKADAVLSALLAPDAMRGRYGHPGGPQGPWGRPGSGGGGPPGGIIFGRRGPYGGRRPGGPVITGSRTQSAGTAEIARSSGGDSIPVDDASALETTLARIRQRYALHFYLPQGVKPGEERAIEVQLADAALRRYPGAEVRYRRVYLAPDNPGGGAGASAEPTIATPSPTLKRRRAVNQPDGPRYGPSVGADGPATTQGGATSAPQGGWPRADPKAQPRPADDSKTAPDTSSGGWRRAKPGEQE